MSEYERIQEAVSFIRAKIPVAPGIGLVLGSGLGEFAEGLQEKVFIPYEQIPHFKKVTVAGHAGQLVIGKCGGTRVAVLQGRYHYYEGHEIRDVVFPVRVLAGWGVKTLLLTNAAGGIAPDLKPGDLLIISDHINLLGAHPLRGENDERIGPRFPDLSAVYDIQIQDVIAAGLRRLGLEDKRGVYAALSGPSYETPAEIRMLRTLGVAAVGMSTVPEAIVARHMGLRVVGISCITNLAAGLSPVPLSHREVTETAERVQKTFIALLQTVLPHLS